jgi:Cof subfamily protein (haloacid dehalogenase superfamily)
MCNRTLNPRNIKALVLDLDGTALAPGPELRERTIKAVQGCCARGLQVIIATGRAIEAAERFRVPLGVEGPNVYFNGAVVAAMPGWKTYAVTLQDKESAEFCVDLSRKTGVYFQAFFPGTPDQPRQRLMAERKGPEWEHYLQHTGIPAEIGDLKEVLANPAIAGCVKTMFLGDAEAQARVRPSVEERYGPRLYIASTLKTFLEMMNPQVSKGEGLKVALKARGLDPSQVIAFGDEENDLPMFDLVSYAIAPANAKPAVLVSADQVIGPNSEESVASFLESNFLS